MVSHNNNKFNPYSNQYNNNKNIKKISILNTIQYLQ